MFRYQIKVISNANRDMRTSVSFMNGENANYVFNCPDGFQRIAEANKFKFSKTRQMFLPSLKPDYMAGFPGFNMTRKE